MGRINAPVFNFRQVGFDRMDVVNGKKTGNAESSGHGRYQTGHPIVAVDKIRLNPWNDIINDLALKCQRKLDVFISEIRVHPVDVIKGAVFRQMDTVIRHFALNPVDFISQHRCQLIAEKSTVIRHGHMDVGTLLEQSTDQGSGNIGKTACFGGIKRCQSSHAVRQIGHFRCNDKDPGVARCFIHGWVPIYRL